MLTRIDRFKALIERGKRYAPHNYKSVPMHIMVICPVRSGTPPLVAKYVSWLEQQGHQVYFPPRDTSQEDPVGFEICVQTRSAMEAANEVHIWYDANSQGCHFDLGIAFALRKPIKLINDPPDRLGKSYLKVIKELQHDLE